MQSMAVMRAPMSETRSPKNGIAATEEGRSVNYCTTMRTGKKGCAPCEMTQEIATLTKTKASQMDQLCRLLLLTCLVRPHTRRKAGGGGGGGKE